MKKLEETTNKVWRQIDKGLDNDMTDDRRDSWERLVDALDRLPFPDERPAAEAREDRQPRAEQQPPQPRADQPSQTSSDPLSWSNLDRVDLEPPTPPSKKRWSMFGRSSTTDIPLTPTAAAKTPLTAKDRLKKESDKKQTKKKTRFADEKTRATNIKTKKEKKTDRQQLLDEDTDDNETVRTFTEHTLDD